LSWIPRGGAIPFNARPHVSLSYNGITLLVGVRPEPGEDGGRAIVYEWAMNQENATKGVWLQMGQELAGKNTSASVKFGFVTGISDDGTIIAIGDPDHPNGNKLTAGCVFICMYDSIEMVWKLLGDEICAQDAKEGVGHSLSISGDGTTIAVTGETRSSPHPGFVRMYTHTEEKWIQSGQSIHAVGLIRHRDW
jgi:hypothetical protein